MEWRTTRGRDSKLEQPMRRISPTPFSSDEGAESGDDSEEDVVTNYLGGGGGGGGPGGGMDPPRTEGGPHPHPHPHRHPQQLPLHHRTQPPTLQRQHQHHGVGVHPAHAHGQPRRLVRMAEIPTMDSMTAESLGMGVSVGGANDPFLPSIPTISITPHSPITQKPFTVLDESLRQVQVMRDKVQKMREDSLPVKSGRGLTRLSSSCPSLNVEGEEGDEEDPPSWSEEFLLDARKSGPPRIGVVTSPVDTSRRKSWSGLSDGEKKRARQRSVSVSSDSEVEEPFFDAEDSARTQGSDSLDGGCRRASEKQRSLSGSSSPVAYVGGRGGPGGGSSSTHSLNEVHLEDKKTKRPTADKPRLLAPRLTLQKSISTPSILAGVTNQQPQKQAPQLSYQYDDDTSSVKPRKSRGSIFFRKKKDKSKKSSHQFVGVCYSNSRTCDVCSKPMTNKPALRCESCLVCVHENTCRDQISDCSKLKNPKKPSIAGTTIAGLSTATKSASLGSTPSGGAFTSAGRAHPASHARSRPPSAHSSLSSSSPTRPYIVAVPSKVNNEDKDVAETLQDVPDANIMDTNSASMESLDDVVAEIPSSEPTLDNIDSDPELRLLENEPELWVNTVDKELVSQLTERQVKKQEHIYELIITEKHHCRMLKIMKELFAEGMSRELGLKESDIKKIFPCLDELITIHFSFLWRLRERQRMGKYVTSIGDLMLEQFVGDNAQGLKDAYGLFCSSHQDAVSNYKDLLKNDRRFQAFIRAKSGHHLMKKKGIPECILFVTHRVTKYPLILEAILKYSKDQPSESETLKKALYCVKDILVNINAQVAEKEKQQRLLDIYNKIDAKSSTLYKEKKFRKSDILINSRTLMFEGQALLSQQRGKQLMVSVVAMSDLIFFLHENNQKYYFVSPDNKAGAIPLGKLLVREKAGQDTRSIYLISGNQNEMFELECSHPKDKRIWLESIRDSVEKCPDDELGIGIKKLNEANSEKIHELLVGMQHQDKEVARVCEDKMRLVTELVSLLGGDVSTLPSPEYRALLDENNMDPELAKDLQITSLNEALRLVGSASGWGTNLSRSVSSVGEHQSDAYVSPSLPKRAETFGGFDNPNKDNSLHLSKQSGNNKKKKDSKASLLSTESTPTGDCPDNLKNRRPSGSSLTVRNSQDNISVASSSGDSPAGAAATPQQQQTLAANLVQCLNTALVLSQHHLTQYEMFRVKVATGTSVDGRFSHSQKLEELRNIQEQISHERAQWTREREHQEKWISDKKDDLKRLQENLRAQQEDINQQREDLYRKLEALKCQGIVLNPCMTVLTSTHSPHLNAHDLSSPGSDPGLVTPQSPHTSPTAVAPTPTRVRQDAKHRNSMVSLSGLKRDSNPSLPTHLISATSQGKGTAVPVKQQLPMKLAKLGTAGSSSSSSTSSMSSSMSSSMGGSMSPSQDKDLPSRVHLIGPPHVAPPPSVQQILPSKLSEGPSEAKIGVGWFGSGYQRLASPPQPANELQGAPAHHRTGSSPASLQNGAHPSASGTGVGPPTTGGKATRTHTYPKLPSRPSAGAPVVEGPSEPLPPGGGNRAPGQPGQRIKDPDTNQDIIFF